MRRYPDTVHAETFYQQRPEGYDRIGSYVSGSNSAGVKLPYFTPTLMRIPPVLYTINNDSDTTGQLRGKIMSWPLSYHNVGAEKDSFSSINSTHPASRIPGVLLRTHPSTVVAVLRFSVPATEVVVMGYTSNLLLYVQRDGLVPSAAALAGECVIAQYDALFSLNKRRNEVWVKLDGHVW